MIERRFKAFALLPRDYIRHNDDYSGVERFFSLERDKVRQVVRHECVLLLLNYRHELPVLKASESTVVNMIRGVTRGICDPDKRCVKAFVNQKFHFDLAIRLRWRVLRVTFRFAQGRAAGRPLRGNARRYREASPIFSGFSAG